MDRNRNSTVFQKDAQASFVSSVSFVAGKSSRKAGFTLLELLLALSIFTLVAGMAAGSFWSITRTWNRANDLLENLHYGEFAMDQLVAALRGAAWFSSKPEAFGFWLDDNGGTSDRAANEISWVTSGTAFLRRSRTACTGCR